MHLSELGWNSHFESHFRPFRDQGLDPARVGRQQDKGFIVITERGERASELAGRDRALSVAVGDWVALRGGLIEAVLPRVSKVSRKAAGAETQEQIVAANVDTLFLVSSLDREFNVRRIERYLMVAWESGASPVVLLNKEDLCDDVEARVAEAEAAAIGVPVHAVSATEHRGLDVVRAHVRAGRTVAFIGSSGVGKSALVNALLGSARQDTGPVREDDARGRHTTTMRELFVMPGGGLLIDTPGMREIQLWADADDLGQTFPEIAAAAARCRYRDCSHEHEPGCGVRGTVDDRRLASFVKLRAELESLDRRRAQKERMKQRGRRPEVRERLEEWE
jgi:ribosome biogenesis GTPase